MLTQSVMGKARWGQTVAGSTPWVMDVSLSEPIKPGPPVELLISWQIRPDWPGLLPEWDQGITGKEHPLIFLQM